MARYDQGGGCACGLHKDCNCKPRAFPPLGNPLHPQALSTRRLWCDMDGVAADFDAGYQALFGHPRQRHSGWDDIRSVPDFFLNLPEMPDFRVLWNGIQHLRPLFLTGTPGSVNQADNDKVQWIRQRVGHVPVVCCKAKLKFQYCEPGDIIIDDSEEYAHLWQMAGGIWVTHKNAVRTLCDLKTLGVL